MLRVLVNCTIFDGVSEDLLHGASVVVEGDRIREVAPREIRLPDAERIDVLGRFVMPGLIDLHFHAYSATFDSRVLDRMPKPLLVSHAIRHLEGALSRGFTTVRDPGGGDVGLSLAIEQGVIAGPRFLYGGRAFAQTGGHGDMRPGYEEEPCECGYSGVISQVVDGADSMRAVAREELRKGAHHLKVLATGGVASPSAPMWMGHFTDRELQAVVDEARSWGRYVAAHCHTDDGAVRCVTNGIRSIEHATAISEPTAKLIAASGTTYTVPTLSVLHQLTEHKHKLGLFPDSLEKIDGLVERCNASIEICMRAGVKVGLGTDLFGSNYHALQSREFRYRAEISPPLDILRSATSINAEIAQLTGRIGVLAPEAQADLIVLDGNPLQDITLFERSETHMPLVMKAGRVIRNRITRPRSR
jgi:imidazolonepropionase-like amidohydrolase